MAFYGLLVLLIGLPLLILGIVSTVRRKRERRDVFDAVAHIVGGCLFIVVGGIFLFIPGESEGVSDGEPTIGCTATVLDADDAHISLNKEHLYKIRVRVVPTEGAPLEVVIRERLDAWEAGAVGGHQKFACVQAASDPERVKIKWTSPR
ncbi:hypothetical protein [Actinomadura fibrosa]|uniref:DUF4190 domain-containing protein n=1 Tax=Actinomadura fibrosa TaxID=111802 RepID=A0ABW2XBN4_9ACTN|nr:hypothetical protein [Actinomadura fibrosa]